MHTHLYRVRKVLPDDMTEKEHVRKRRRLAWDVPPSEQPEVGSVSPLFKIIGLVFPPRFIFRSSVLRNWCTSLPRCFGSLGCVNFFLCFNFFMHRRIWLRRFFTNFRIRVFSFNERRDRNTVKDRELKLGFLIGCWVSTNFRVRVFSFNQRSDWNTVIQ